MTKYIKSGDRRVVSIKLNFLKEARMTKEKLVKSFMTLKAQKRLQLLGMDV